MSRGIHTLVCLMAVGFVGCRQQPKEAAQPPPVEVSIVTVAPEPIPVVTELPGRLDAFRVAEVRARATGILLKRLFEEGSTVTEGDVLFQIDPAPLEAAHNSALATLARAEANAIPARTKAKRFQALADARAVSQQDLESALAASTQADADVQVAKAAVETARLNLGYATVTAPISGRIGAASVTEGALVSQTEATHLATIQQIDPIYFDFSQSSTEGLRLRRELEQGRLVSVAPGAAKVTLILDDGTLYPETGKLLFSDVSVDPTTGMILLRALFPNPDHLLLPGMFARGRLEQAVDTQAITVPQRAVTRGAGGVATVFVVSSGEVVELRAIKTSTALHDKWIVIDGLKAGDRVIVEGLQKIRAGSAVQPVPFRPAPATNDVAAAGSSTSAH